jgi:hypothetical protein
MRKASIMDKTHVIQILAKSFSDNKSVNYVVKQDQKKEERIKALMEYSFDVCYAFGEVWMSNDDQACALILFPDKKKTSLRTILWDVKLALSVIGIDRVNTVLKRESMIKNNHPKDSFAYLWFAECERKRRPIYLETSTQKNIPFYKKFGFEIFQSLNLNYTLYQLRRV